MKMKMGILKTMKNNKNVTPSAFQSVTPVSIKNNRLRRAGHTLSKNSVNGKGTEIIRDLGHSFARSHYLKTSAVVISDGVISPDLGGIPIYMGGLAVTL
jgi:hypothetical protein